MGCGRETSTGRSRLRLFRVVFAWCALIVAPASAQAAGEPLFYSPAAATDVPATEPFYEDTWSGPFPFNSRSAKEQRVRVDAALTGPADAPAPTLAVLSKNGASQPFPSEGVTLAALDTLIVRVTARLPRPGDYILRLRLLATDGAELTTVARKLVRAPDVLPSAGIAEATVPTRLVEGGSVSLRMPLSGLAGRAVRFTATEPRVVRVGTGGGETLAGLVPTISNDCDNTKKGAVVVLGADESCALQVALTGVSPGDYRVRLKLQGQEGAPRSLDLPFKARASHWCMLLWLLVGAAGGAFLAWWRDGQQDRASAALAVARLQEELTWVRAAMTDARPYSDGLDADLRRLRAILASGGALETVEEGRAAIAGKVALFGRIAQAWTVAVGHPGHDALRQKRDNALAAVTGEAAAAVSAVDAFANAVAAFVMQANAPAATGSTESAMQTGVIDLSWLGQAVGEGDGVTVILRKQRVCNIVATIVLTLFFALFALVTVWWPDADWGDFADRATAVFIGAAAFGGVAGTLGTFRTTIKGVATGG